MMILATFSVVFTMMTPMELGMMCFIIILMLLLPPALAASIYSASERVSTWERTSLT